MRLLKIKELSFYFIFIFTLAVMTASVYFFVLFYKSLSWRDDISKSCADFCVDKALVYAVIKCESDYNPDAVSSSGAVGLMQIMPDTAEFIADMLGVKEYDLSDPQLNIKFGVAYLKYLLNKFSFDAAIAAYNAGEGRVKEWLTEQNYSSDGESLDDIPFAETKNYIKKVKTYYKNYRMFI